MTAAAAGATPIESLAMMMRALKLPSFARHAEEVAQKAEREGWTFGHYLSRDAPSDRGRDGQTDRLIAVVAVA